MPNIDAVGGDSFSLQWSQKSAADFPHRVKQNLLTRGAKKGIQLLKKRFDI
jgi:hypothetical protein